MYGKIQASGLTEFFPFISTSATWGQILFPDCLYPNSLFRCGGWLLFPSLQLLGSHCGVWQHLLDCRNHIPFLEPLLTFLANLIYKELFHFTPELGRSPGEESGNPLQCSCLGNLMDRGSWRATVHGVAKESNLTEQLNNNNHVYGCQGEYEISSSLKDGGIFHPPIGPPIPQRYRRPSGIIVQERLIIK